MSDPRIYAATETLRNGGVVTVRAIRGDDRQAVLEAFRGLDRQSVYTRFFTFKKGLTETEVRQLTEPDFDHVVALVVVEDTGNGEMLVGGARYCSEAALRRSRTAELAFVTAERCKGRGIAGLLLRHLVLIARDQGLSQLDAEVLAQNRAMLKVFERSGLSMRLSHEANVVHVSLLIDEAADA